MKTGTALVLCFAMWFGWARYAEYTAQQAKDAAAKQEQVKSKIEAYDYCVDIDNRHSTAELDKFEKDCALILTSPLYGN